MTDGLRPVHPAVPVLAAAGIAAPIVFTIVVIVQARLHADYSDIALPISALAAWPSGWIQNLNFYVFGLLMTAYAVGLHLGLRGDRGGAVGPAILVLSGVGIVIAGAFPWQMVDGGLVVPIGHRAGAVLAFLGAGLGLILTSRRMARDPQWRSVARYAGASGIVIVALFVAMGILAVPEDAPLHAWAGLLQRLVLLVWFPCTIAVAIKLRSVARPAANASSRR